MAPVITTQTFANSQPFTIYISFNSEFALEKPRRIIYLRDERSFSRLLVASLFERIATAQVPVVWDLP